ncbi:MAG TPA: GNAT family N-acetyltransferase [Planctomycetota bacterium]|nr:GNAT family N-acetyltransferase [Planctomycetota bacterium]
MNVREVLSEIDLRGSVARLRPPRAEDSELTFRLIAGRREILDWLEWSGPATAQDMLDQALHWRKESDDAANYQLAILRAPREGDEREEVVGAMSIRFIDHPERGDLGYWIAPEHQGQGLASDAVGLAAWLAFEVLEASSVSACVFVPNVASRRVLEKHGFSLREEASCAASCDERPRWNFLLDRSAWILRAAALRPLEFHFAFTPARP